MQNINYLQAENSKESGLNRTFHMNQEANTSEILNRDKKRYNKVSARCRA